MQQEKEIQQPSSTKGSLYSHIAELQRRLRLVVLALIVFSCIGYYFSNDIFRLLAWPYIYGTNTLANTNKNYALSFIYTAPQEYFFVKMKIALIFGVFLSLPTLLWQIYKFAAPGLYEHEKRYFFYFSCSGPILFLIGGAFSFFLVMPIAMHFFWLIGQHASNNTIKITILPKVSEYINLSLVFLFAFGICFQLPLILVFLSFIHVVTAKQLKNFRRYAIIIIFILSAILTPPDVFSQILLGIPLIILYELSIIFVRIMEKNKK